ncbi:hypothetical protein [Streptomyces sp. HUAS TT7]|uniref:hypothetical protein n=1 Tax=Streptomyces sp. HUAS TT7 TaxID=3447507 RepID=UPI003F65D7C3
MLMTHSGPPAGSPEAASPGNRLRARAAWTAVALQFRGAPVGASLLFAVTVAVGVTPAATAWLAKLLFDELGRGAHADVRHAVVLAVATASLGALSAVLLQLAAYLDELVHRRLVVEVERVSAVPGDPVPPEVRAVVGAPDGSLVPPGSLVVRGDAARTQDSRHFGYVPRSALLGVVVTRPAARKRGPVRPHLDPAR